MWRILLPHLLCCIQQQDHNLKQRINIAIASNQNDDLNILLSTKKFRSLVANFKVQHKDNPNIIFWWDYLQMVEILLMFTRAERDGIWRLHLYSFRSMLPYFHHYDHTNYARWGAIYLAEMNQLPPEVLTNFEKGDFVVKRNNRLFNQVSPDQSLEWLNATGKSTGGIVGITRSTVALSRSMGIQLEKSNQHFYKRNLWNWVR